MMSKNEYMKLFDYILENYNKLSDETHINNDFLLHIRNYVKGKTNVIILTETQNNIIINHFLKHGFSFNKDTPKIIKDNEQCFIKSICNDIYSINYIKNISININKYIDFIIRKKYIISNESPILLRKNYDIIINSIKLNNSSADYIIFDSLNNENKKLIINELLKTDYILNNNSSKYLRNNKSIIIHSINLDVDSYKYSSISFEKDYDIFKTLLDNNYYFNEDDINNIKKIPLSFITSSKMLNHVFKIIDIYVYDDEDYQNQISNLYYSLLTTYPTIKSFNNIINYLSDKGWDEYRQLHFNDLSNIYGKIISIIKNNENYNNFCHEFSSLENEMLNVLGDKYNILIDSIKEYHQLFHSNNLDKTKLSSLSLIISKLSSLYISTKKEQYKLNIKESFYNYLIKYYIPRLDNKIINRKVQYYIKRDIFLKQYKTNNQEITSFINNLTNKYINTYGNWISKPITKFLKANITNLKYITKCPNNYKLYLEYIEAMKLVNRLNRGYIKYDDQELINYKDDIIFNNNEYKCTIKINKFNINQCNEYHNKEIIFKHFIKEVIIFINNMRIDENTYNKYLESIDINKIIKGLPFTDEYYKFNNQVLNDYSLYYFKNQCICESNPIEISSINNNYKEIYEIFKNNNLIWLWVLDNCKEIIHLLFTEKIKIHYMCDIFNNIDNIKSISNYLKIDYINYSSLSFFNTICTYSNNRILNLINPEILKTLCTKIDYTSGYRKEEIIKIASDLICQMAKRNSSTVPYINGYFNEYHYTMYDNQEDDVLITGPLADSCLKICGNDNDFLHYCMLDKNGFIIKITDNNNQFIGRTAGFRNGNIIYLNQLRTIYDKGGSGYCSNCNSEKSEIIKALIKACEDIIKISKDNDKETVKIDYIFITQSYAFYDYPITQKIKRKILGKYPIDISKSDWQVFINNTNNLLDSKTNKCFNTDYNEFDLICIAQSKNNDKINNNDINKKDVEAVYKRPRNKIIVTSNITEEIIKKINKIRAIYTYYHKNIEYFDINIPNNSIVIIGDNWYIIYKQKILDYCIQDFDEIAKKEFNQISNILLEYQSEKQLKEKIKVLNNK